jgi:2,3-bisphosphoglycerate-independent phosphoglycerate mutase
MAKLTKKVVFIIMDGWGIAKPDKFNAIDNALTPNIDRLVRTYPNTLLRSDGETVGLEAGQFGTSEINHLTIGSGRVIEQDLTKINRSIKTGEFFRNEALLAAILHAESRKSNLHLLGIISDGGVHSHINHLFAIFKLLNTRKFAGKVFLHLFSDGRDTPPKSVTGYLKQLDEQISRYPQLKIILATLQGRMFLDRDRDWPKTETAFDLIARNKGNKMSDWQAVVNFEYNKDNRDEFFSQYLLCEGSEIKANDSVIFFHFRTDRQYQLTQRILNEKLKNLSFCSFVKSSEEFAGLHIAFPRENVSHTLSEVISAAGLKQLHITETEKYPHLTYFFNGEREHEYPGETWKLLESNRFVKPRYDFEPSMRNFDTSKEIIAAINSAAYDFIVTNLASPDMVGHTGNYEAAVVSAEAVDFCIGEIYKAIEAKLDDYVMIVTADHGNSDIMWDYKNNQPHTQHTLSKVPFIVISNLEHKLHRRDSLQDIAPTILELLGLTPPTEMRGESLLLRS